MKKSTNQYYIIYEKDEKKGYVASAPAIPGCVVYGKTLSEAHRKIRFAIKDCLEVIREFHQKDKLVRTKNKKKETTRYRSYARGTLNRTRNINIRLSERDLQKIKARAAERGIPYQTLVASIIHQYGTRA